MDADSAAEREAEKNGLLGSDVQLFVVDALKDSATQRKIVKETKDMIQVLESLMVRRIVSEMNKQLKERTNLR